MEHCLPSVPILTTDLIDNHTNIVDAGTSCYGGLVKGKGGEWEECTGRTMPILQIGRAHV